MSLATNDSALTIRLMATCLAFMVAGLGYFM